MPGISDVRNIGHLGDYIREQRASSQISLRQLAKLAGVSNPYLSQIERGLRKPSAEILQQIAKGLRVSAEAMYVQAGILEHRDGSPVVDAVLADTGLSERQKQVLLEIHDSFRKENAAAVAAQNLAPTLEALEVTGLVTPADGTSVGVTAPDSTEAVEAAGAARRRATRSTTGSTTGGAAPRAARSRRTTPSRGSTRTATTAPDTTPTPGTTPTPKQEEGTP